jgi:hypothetical protein
MSTPAVRARLITMIVAATCVCVAAARSVTEVDDAVDTVRVGLAPAHERELKPFRALAIPAGVADGAAALIPPDATYVVVVGTTLPLDAAQRIAVPDMLHYWLLPRRWREGTEGAQWVIAYGAPTETIDARLGSQTEVSPGVVVAEIESLVRPLASSCSMLLSPRRVGSCCGRSGSSPASATLRGSGSRSSPGGARRGSR